MNLDVVGGRLRDPANHDLNRKLSFKAFGTRPLQLQDTILRNLFIATFSLAETIKAKLTIGCHTLKSK